MSDFIPQSWESSSSQEGDVLMPESILVAISGMKENGESNS
jgi:hypothetical protein